MKFLEIFAIVWGTIPLAIMGVIFYLIMREKKNHKKIMHDLEEKQMVAHYVLHMQIDKQQECDCPNCSKAWNESKIKVLLDQEFKKHQ
jgi:hypothetical protein